MSFSFFAAGQSLPGPPQAPRPQPPDHQPESSIAQQQQSIAIQQQAVERQRALTAAQSPPSPRVQLVPAPPRMATGSGEDSAPFAPGCDPVSPMVLSDAVQKAATAYKVAPGLIHAVIRQESAGYPCAVSDKGAIGLMQLMPETASQMGASEPFDVEQNINAGTRLLAELMQRYKGDLNRVLGAYNAGAAAVDRAGGPPPFAETLNYIRSIVDQIKPIDPKLFASPVR
ncbi:MAG TPA: lytic transglycosylase domain-containing protein [Bryobacteraceae bacterium]|jgi:soluble lytic murein transglycosylase-like protein